MKNIFKFSCPITSALDIIGDRWILIILKQMLFEDKQTFKDLKESSENIASNILTVRLNSLLKNGLISKSKIKTNNKSIFYHLTDLGLSVSSILTELGIWGKENLADYNQLMNKKEDAPKIKHNNTHIKNLKKRYKAKLAKTKFIKI